MEKCNGVWWYLKVEGKYRHHPSRGRKYMLDDAASRKSDNTMPFVVVDGAPLHTNCV